MQMTCRDRNRIALQSDLLSAGALGIPNLLLMTGDRPERGDHADATARVRPRLRQPDGRRPRPARRRARCSPGARSTRRRGSCSARSTPAPGAPDRLARKVADGARVRPDAVRVRRRRLRGLDGAGARPRAARAVRRSWRASGRSGRCGRGVHGRASRGGRARGVRERGCAACPPTGWPPRGWPRARRRWPRCASCPGVAGVHVMAVGYEQGVPEILAAAGPAGPRVVHDEGGPGRSNPDTAPVRPPSPVRGRARSAPQLPGPVTCRAVSPSAPQAPHQQDRPDDRGAAAASSQRGSNPDRSGSCPTNAATAMPRVSSPTTSATRSGPRRLRMTSVCSCPRSCSATAHLHVSGARVDVDRQQRARTHAVGARGPGSRPSAPRARRTSRSSNVDVARARPRP